MAKVKEPYGTPVSNEKTLTLLRWHWLYYKKCECQNVLLRKMVQTHHLPDFCLLMPRDSWYLINLIAAHIRYFPFRKPFLTPGDETKAKQLV